MDAGFILFLAIIYLFMFLVLYFIMAVLKIGGETVESRLKTIGISIAVVFLGAGLINVGKQEWPGISENLSGTFSSLWSVRVDIFIVLGIVALVLFLLFVLFSLFMD